MNERELTQLNAFKKFRVKLKAKGWKKSQSEKSIRVDENENLIIELLDPAGHKHWLKISPKGDIVFAPTRMTCF